MNWEALQRIYALTDQPTPLLGQQSNALCGGTSLSHCTGKGAALGAQVGAEEHHGTQSVAQNLPLQGLHTAAQRIGMA